MSENVNWDIDKHRGEHEIEGHWELRRKFMERWKSEFPEEKLVTLSQVFANIEFLGCNYSPELMQEVARMSDEVAYMYREERKTKLQRTFVSASEAAQDRAQGTKQGCGVVIKELQNKIQKIAFVQSGQGTSNDEKEKVLDESAKSSGIDPFPIEELKASCSTSTTNATLSNVQQRKAGCNKDVTYMVCELVTEHEKIDYMEEMSHVECETLTYIEDHMFDTCYGQFVLLVRVWQPKLWNIQVSCQLCNIKYELYHDVMTKICTLMIGDKIVAQAYGITKKLAKKAVENLAFKVLTNQAITILVKEPLISQDESPISLSEVTESKHESEADMFGAPVEATVAAQMMKMMGWQGGGLGAAGQGIAEPVRPHLQIVPRAGLGTDTANIQQIRTATEALIKRFSASDCVDVDLVFSSEFSKIERAAVHRIAGSYRLLSRSYGNGKERFLVVKKKVDVFQLAKAIVSKGGQTPKYVIYIPLNVVPFKTERE